MGLLKQITNKELFYKIFRRSKKTGTDVARKAKKIIKTTKKYI